MNSLPEERSWLIQTGTEYKGLEFRGPVGDESGMGDVWLAYQPAIKREVVVKVIKPEYANKPHFIRRFEWEAQLVARLEHPNIVPLYDFWREPGGAFLVMRYLRGGSLRNQLEEAPHPAEKVLGWLQQIGAALQLAHNEGIIHRDIKPANILLDESGTAYLVDFGIAWTDALEPENDQPGTMGYLAPEQFRGEASDQRTDLFSLGVVLYELLTGKRAFKGIDGMARLLNVPLPALQDTVPDLPDELNDVIQKATAKASSERYQQATALVDDFATVLGHVSNAPEDPYMITIDVPNPYRGLRAFQESDETNFYGRGALIDRLLERLSQTEQEGRLLAVVGPSGSGKSSIVKAGLLPRIRQNAIPGSEKWFIAETFPGVKPFEELETALMTVAVNPPKDLVRILREDNGIGNAIEAILPAGDNELLLVIDQFEELFTLASSSDTAAFIDALLAVLEDSKSRLRVVITLRADFYDRPLNFLEFGDLLRKRTEIVLPMTTDDLYDAIVQPAQNTGVTFEPGLVERMIEDVAEEPGGLPLLQYALTELFDRREGRILTQAAYHELGGITGALAKRADDEYDNATPQQRDTIRQIFLRLVAPGEGTEDTRRRVHLSELGDADTVTGVLNAYSAARLLTTDRDPETREPTVEVAHEALIREWARLRNWLNDTREDLYIQRRLMQEATEWLLNNRDPGLLAGGTRLIQFEEYASTTSLQLNDAETEYLQASTNEQQARQTAEEARKAHESRISRRARNFQRASLVLGCIIILALIGGLYGSLVALNNIDEQRNIANTLAAEAFDSANAAATSESASQRQANVAQSLALSSQSQLLVDQNHLLSIALGLNAVQIDDPPAEAQQALTQVGLNPGPMKQLFSNTGGDIRFVSYSPDGRTILSGQFDGTIDLFDAASGEMIWSISAHDDELTSVAFSPDGRQVISAGFDGQVFGWDVANQQKTSVLALPDDAIVTSLAYVPDGSSIIAGTDIGIVRIFDANSGQLIRELTGHDDYISSLAVSPDGTRALSGSDDTTAILWDLSSGEAMQQLADHTDWVTSVAFSPVDQTALTGSRDGSVILWDLERGSVLRTLNEHAGIVYRAIYSPDGRYALSASDDTSIILWELDSGVVLQRLVGHVQAAVDVSFHPDGGAAVSASYDGTVVVWDLLGAFVQQRYFGHDDWVTGVDYSPDGQRFVSASADSTLILWDAASAEPLERLVWGRNSIQSVAFAPDGNTVLFADIDGIVALWDIESGEVTHEMNGHGDVDWMRVAFLPDGRHAVSGGNDGRIIYWDLQTGEAVQTIVVPAGGVRSVTITPDDQYLAASTDAGQLFMWKPFADAPTYTFETDAGLPIATFSPDMSRVAAGTTEGEIIVWDVTSGEIASRLFGHRSFVYGLAFHTDGERLFSGSNDGDLVTWDVQGGVILHRLTDHTDVVTDIALSPDGHTVLTASDDRSVLAWDTGVELQTIQQKIEWICTNRAILPLSDTDRLTYRLNETVTFCS